MNREKKNTESNLKVQSTMQNAKPGEIITFGTYPESEDGIELPIKWRVLQNSDSELCHFERVHFGLQAVSRQVRGY